MARRAKKPSGKAKGDIVEAIATWLHDWPGIEVQQKARVPALNDPSRRAEIDVLLTTSVAGYSVRIAIECKNEAEPIGAPYINAFIGKLQDIGVPPQQGIFISASRYTKDAVRRARKEGIRTLLLRGLSADGLKASISTAAFQSHVFLLARVAEVTYFTKEPDTLPHIPLFADASGQLCGTVPHLIAQAWEAGKIPATVGVYDLTIPIPDGWRPFVSTGQPVDLLKPEIYTRVRVTAFAFTIEGKAEEYALVDFTTSRPEKVGVRAFFDATGERYALTPFESEAELESYLASHKGIRIVTRVKVPKIHYLPAYWPLSRRAAMRFLELSPGAKTADGSIRQIETAEVEGLSIAAAWEPALTIPELRQVFLDARARSRPVTPDDEPKS